MLSVTLLCVGRMREAYYMEAFAEDAKRLGAFCRLAVTELPEQRLPERPAASEIDAALEKEAREILRLIPKGAATVALCVEGERMTSPELARRLADFTARGGSRLCFVVGGSYGLHPSVKRAAALRLSMSDLTFPHHLARVMLIEQLYRAFTINAGARYHK